MNHKKIIEKAESLLSGKVPPNAPDLEQAVIAAILLEKDAYEQVAPIISPDVFYDPKHQVVVKGMIELHKAGSPIDILTLTQYLTKSKELSKLGGAVYITGLTNGVVASAANIRYHAHLLYEMYIKRKAIEIGTGLLQDGFDEGVDAFDMQIKHLKALQSLIEPVAALSYTPFTKQVERAIQTILEASTSEGDITGIPTGFKALDRITNGLRRGKLVVIAARSGAGKTSAAVNIAVNMVEAGYPVDLYSLEESDRSLIVKIISSKLQTSVINLDRGKVDVKALGTLQEQMNSYPLSIQDTSNMWIQDICSRIRVRSREAGVKIVMLDYIQLAKVRDLSKQATRENEVATITRMLKQTAKDEDVLVIALSQVKRIIDERSDPRPKLADLRESSSIENDSDMVIFIYRPEHHRIYYDANGHSTHMMAFFDVAKHRGGAIDECKMHWHGEYASFSDIPDGWQAKYEPNADTRKKNGKKYKLKDFTEPVKEGGLPF